MVHTFGPNAKSQPDQDKNKYIVRFLWGVSIAAMLVLIAGTYISNLKENFLTTQPTNFFDTQQSINIHLTPEQFKNRFNQAAAKYNADVNIRALKVKYGVSQNTFEYSLTENTSIVGIVNEDGTIRSITVLGLKNGAASTDNEITETLLIILTAFDPTISSSQQNDLMKQLASQSQTGELFYNNKKYFYYKSTDSNIMLTITNTDNKEK